MRSSPALLRASPPFLAFTTFVLMLDYCNRLARASGHMTEELWSLHPPVISNLGMFYPEHYWFEVGFSLIAVFVAITMVMRISALGRDARVARSGGLRWSNRISVGAGVLSLIALLVMGWVPYRPPGGTHFVASLLTYLFLAIYELIHGGMCLALLRRRGSGATSSSAGILLSLWFMVCPLLSVACVVIRITQGSVPAQYMSVALQFAYFLPMSKLLVGAGEAREERSSAGIAAADSAS